MPQETVSVRKIKEVLRLRFGLGLRQDQIAQSCSIGQATVHRYLERAAAAGLSCRCRTITTTNGWDSCCFRLAPASRIHTFVPYPILPKPNVSFRLTSI